MADSTSSLLGRLKTFGFDLGIAPPDVEKIIQANRRNVETIEEMTQVAGRGAQSLVSKQQEILESGLREVASLVQSFKPGGQPQDIVAKQAAFAKRAFEIALQGTKDVSELATNSTKEAIGVFRARLEKQVEEARSDLDTGTAKAKPDA